MFKSFSGGQGIPCRTRRLFITLTRDRHSIQNQKIHADILIRCVFKILYACSNLPLGLQNSFFPSSFLLTFACISCLPMRTIRSGHLILFFYLITLILSGEEYNVSVCVSSLTTFKNLKLIFIKLLSNCIFFFTSLRIYTKVAFHLPCQILEL
jgi:hypothetical protein